ncbi:MAG: 4-(cytidine 5'-diphospho)-2-C-methyl-D-erythritol kinase [Acidobacteriaceae bacterium]|jgi:4-diphosphocytidyl-2-C-methyl-D-erythritol kinase|nr:4-(cytidine 5'-diphospho)-2-C-methyl-D-erythritol kinase [Acidobacteriaceae bacterium]
MKTLTVRAFAKINLTLRLLGIRADGFHELRTTFQSLALHDTLEFAVTSGPFAIECDDPSMPRDRTNLIWKAAALVGRTMSTRRALPPVVVRVTKRIPSQAGLGGGSSDAAATLGALARLYRLSIPEAALTEMARSLGADVPYFLHGGTALGIERGDVLFPLADLPPVWVVIVQPPFGVSTADAYRWWDEAANAAAVGRRSSRRTADLDAFLLPSSELRNDLEPPVAARHPEIAALVRRLYRDGARYAAMSGSGSAVFGLFAAESAAREVARAFGGRAVVTKTLSRREYERRRNEDLRRGLPVMRATC